MGLSSTLFVMTLFYFLAKEIIAAPVSNFDCISLFCYYFYSVTTLILTELT